MAHFLAQPVDKFIMVSGRLSSVDVTTYEMTFVRMHTQGGVLFWGCL